MRPTEFPKTLQEIFNIVWARSKDKRQALRGPGYCSYRSNSRDLTSMACFIGECIPDSMYIPQLDGNSIDSGIADVLHGFGSIFPIEWNGIVKELESLQEIHDLYDPSDWEQNLVDFAKQNKLLIPDA